MNTHRYDHFEKEELILRDQLAIDRTMLANDRTLLSFARTALTLLIAGASILQFLEGQKWHTVGWFVGCAGIIVLIIGFMRYRRIHKELSRMIHTMRNRN